MVAMWGQAVWSAALKAHTSVGETNLNLVIFLEPLAGGLSGASTGG